MESTVVVKVKFGETLRRFNARVNEAGQLDLDIGGLRDKVIDLFNFAPDTDLTLTYIDEDGDEVTLVDEEDLWDVMRQSLNPLRITVKLNAEKGGRFYARSSGNSTPMRSPRVQHPLHSLNSSLSEILKSVPQSFREPLSKLLLDLASKAASSSPTLFELLDSISKTRQCNIHPVSVFQDGTESNTQSQASGSTMAASMTKEPEGDRGATLEVMPNANVGEPTSIQKVDLMNSSRGVDASVTPTARSLNLNAELPGDSLPSGSVSANLPQAASHDAVGGSKEEATKFGESHLSGKASNSTWKNIQEVASRVFASDNDKEVKKSGVEWNCVNIGASSSTVDATKCSIMDSNTTASVGIIGTKFPTLLPVNDCPFVGLPVTNDSAVPYTHYGSRVHPFKNSYNHNDDMGSIFHKGVRCDGCGVYPITGPRFKSKVKEDYDLCIVCFSEMGNLVDYVRMDRPVSHRNPYSSKELYIPKPRVRLPTLPHVRDCGMKPNQPKLDSRFVMDVNVPDGTIMAPSTPFTKIWRMRNNGTMVWPRGTQLVWIGGDKLSAELSVELQIDDGFTMDELDIAVDFTAPALPGRYVSYWRMASPSGQKFGQRVWVLIQVDAPFKDYMWNSFQGLNLNLPPEGSGNPENINVNIEPIAVEASLPVPDNSDMDTELVEPPSADTGPNKDQELNFPINDTLLVGGGGGGVSNTLPPKAATSDSYPTIPVAASAGTSHVPSPSIVLPASVQDGGNENINVEQSLLRELEEMGFKQVDLNKEILRMNEYDLEQSVDDLCGVAEWDPILKELQEMGFSDKEMNKRLLKKNNGSIKRVVMDLITGENA